MAQKVTNYHSHAPEWIHPSIEKLSLHWLTYTNALGRMTSALRVSLGMKRASAFGVLGVSSFLLELNLHIIRSY